VLATAASGPTSALKDSLTAAVEYKAASANFEHMYIFYFHLYLALVNNHWDQIIIFPKKIEGFFLPTGIPKKSFEKYK